MQTCGFGQERPNGCGSFVLGTQANGLPFRFPGFKKKTKTRTARQEVGTLVGSLILVVSRFASGAPQSQSGDRWPGGGTLAGPCSSGGVGEGGDGRPGRRMGQVTRTQRKAAENSRENISKSQMSF